MKIRTLIVDDEPLARERLRTLLGSDTEIEVVAEAADGRSAIAAIRGHAPDLVFLDVQMPDLDGFGVLQAVGGAMPATVFVTAYDQYALRAFDVHALDYLLKPFDRDRFDKALARAKADVRERESREVTRRLIELLDDLREKPRYLERIVIKSGGRVFFLRASEVDWIEAAGNYVKLHAGKETHLLRDTMTGIEEKLDPAQFVRVHRSAIVNLDCIEEMRPWFRGDQVIRLRTGARLTLSRGYREKFEDAIGRGRP